MREKKKKNKKYKKFEIKESNLIVQGKKIAKPSIQIINIKIQFC
jgi:protein involved in sex pheromone biosynthesis